MWGSVVRNELFGAFVNFAVMNRDTLRLIKHVIKWKISKYWFPKMKKCIRKYVSTCLSWAFDKKWPGRYTGYFHPILKRKEIFHIYLDIYILAIILNFNKFIFDKAICNTRSCSTIRVLADILALFGVLDSVNNIRPGNKFYVYRVQRIFKSTGSKYVLNAVSTTRANGQIDRYNSTILGLLSSINHDLNESDWDLNLTKTSVESEQYCTEKTTAKVMLGPWTINPYRALIMKMEKLTHHEIGKMNK